MRPTTRGRARCAYQNQTSLAWVPMPEAELWTFNDRQPEGLSERIGINLGAPGDRRDADGTLWLEYPADRWSLAVRWV